MCLVPDFVWTYTLVKDQYPSSHDCAREEGTENDLTTDSRFPSLYSTIPTQLPSYHFIEANSLNEFLKSS